MMAFLKKCLVRLHADSKPFMLSPLFAVGGCLWFFCDTFKRI
jgi:hypothetical protein